MVSIFPARAEQRGLIGGTPKTRPKHCQSGLHLLDRSAGRQAVRRASPGPVRNGSAYSIFR